jgi:hypothetical protein
MNIISGHAPGPIRDAFLESVDAGKPDKVLAGRLWNCTDILPSAYCREVGIQQGGTYAQAVRKLRKA